MLREEGSLFLSWCDGSICILFYLLCLMLYSLVSFAWRRTLQTHCNLAHIFVKVIMADECIANNSMLLPPNTKPTNIKPQEVRFLLPKYEGRTLRVLKALPNIKAGGGVLHLGGFTRKLFTFLNHSNAKGMWTTEMVRVLSVPLVWLG